MSETSGGGSGVAGLVVLKTRLQVSAYKMALLLMQEAPRLNAIVTL